jgi:hypothetical protein
LLSLSLSYCFYLQDELNELGEKFRAKVELAQSSSIFPMATQAAFAAAMRGAQSPKSTPYFDGLSAEVLRSLALAQHQQLMRQSLLHNSPTATSASDNVHFFNHGLADISLLYAPPTARLDPSSMASPELSSSEKGSIQRPKLVEAYSPKSAEILSRLVSDQNEFIVPAKIGTDSREPISSGTLAGNVLRRINSEDDERQRLSKLALYEAHVKDGNGQPFRFDQSLPSSSSSSSISATATTSCYEMLCNGLQMGSSYSHGATDRRSKKDKKGKKYKGGSSGSVHSMEEGKKHHGNRRFGGRRQEGSVDSNHTQQQQQELLSQLQMELLSSTSILDGTEKTKSKTASNLKKTRSLSNRQLQSQSNQPITHVAQPQHQHLHQHQPANRDLYASDLLINFFKAANNSEKDSSCGVSRDNAESHPNARQSIDSVESSSVCGKLELKGNDGKESTIS